MTGQELKQLNSANYQKAIINMLNYYFNLGVEYAIEEELKKARGE